LFSQLDTAADFIRHYLPEHLVAAIDLTTLEILKESFVDEELRQYFSDLLLRVKLKSGGEAFIYILLEHKSSPDDLVALQLLIYLARIWQPNLRDRTKPLPLIFPVVFYHGEESWNVSRSFNTLFDFTGLESLREYAPEFKYHLCDLSKIEITKGEARLRAGMAALKYGRSDELPSRLREIFETIKQLPEWRVMVYIRTVLKYLLNVTDKLTGEIIKLEVETVFPEQKGEIMKSLAQEWIEEGEQRGEQKGMAKLVLRRLHRHFGILEAELQEQIRSLSTEQLENLDEALPNFTLRDDLLAWLDKEMKQEAQP
jgi:predicted transposase/invertase (TIGR01784 family)